MADQLPRVGPLAADELEAVAALSVRALPPGLDAAALSDELARDASTVLVARLDGRVAGYAVAWVVAGEGELHAIAVDPAVRRRGVGRALLDAVLALAPTVHLEVRADNEAARTLYEGAGFEVTDVRRGYYRDGADALLMTRRGP